MNCHNGEQYLKKIDPDVKIYREIITDDEGQKILTFGFKITDKIRKHILTEGIESFNKGGVVLILCVLIDAYRRLKQDHNEIIDSTSGNNTLDDDSIEKNFKFICE